jgi:hypothetical protein
MITHKQYYDITNCVGNFRIPEFTIEEVQIFLTKLGYEVKVYSGLAKVEHVEMGFNEVIHTGKYSDMERQCIVAVKYGDVLPERVDQCGDFNFITVFNKEIKNKLMNL